MARSRLKKSFLNNLKRLNQFAQQLRDRRFHQRIVEDKTKYKRKKYVWKRYEFQD